MARKSTEEEVLKWLAGKHYHTVLVSYQLYNLYHTFVKDANVTGDTVLTEARALYPQAITVTYISTSLRATI